MPTQTEAATWLAHRGYQAPWQDPEAAGATPPEGGDAGPGTRPTTAEGTSR